VACKGFDEQVVRLDQEISNLARQFVLARVVNMRGVDLNRFDFDYDLTWMSFFMNGYGQIYGRYGGRDAGDADKYHSLASLKNAMRAALAAYRRDPNRRPPDLDRPPRKVEQYPAASRLKEGACIHCHQVYDFQREALKAAGQWRREDIWVYPLPQNVGLTLDLGQQNLVRSVAPGSPADRAGLKPGDTLRKLNAMPATSFGDCEYALHHAPATGSIPVSWQRGRRSMGGKLLLAKGWRETDISWRASMWGLEPQPCVYGEDLTAGEKQALGLPPKNLAFRQGQFVPKPARAAGVQAKDIIFGIDDRPLSMTMLQFNTYVRLNYHVGDKITFHVIRDGKRLDLPMVLPAKATF
jgi:serine protease Do